SVPADLRIRLGKTSRRRPVLGQSHGAGVSLRDAAIAYARRLVCTSSSALVPQTIRGRHLRLRTDRAAVDVRYEKVSVAECRTDPLSPGADRPHRQLHVSEPAGPDFVCPASG